MRRSSATRPRRAKAGSCGALTGIWGKSAMEGLEALLSNLKRALTPGSAEAPLAWLLVVIVVLLLALGALLLLRRPTRARNEVEHFFLASAAATRKEREISEIDAFARRASAIGGGPQGARAQAPHRALPAGQDLHRPFQLHPHLDAGGAQPRPAAGARHQLDDLAASADGGDERVAVEGAQEPAGAASIAAPTSTARCSRRTTSSCSRPCCGWSRRRPTSCPCRSACARRRWSAGARRTRRTRSS